MAKQKLVTKALEKAFRKFPLYSQEHTAADDKVVVCKFFHPCSRFTFYVTEGRKEEQGDNWTFFGFVVAPHAADGDEWGYLDLKSMMVPSIYGLACERDKWFPTGKLTFAKAKGQ